MLQPFREWRVQPHVHADGAFGDVLEPSAVEPVAHAQSARIFELRTYTAPDGKLADLHARFKNHTMRIFKKHNIENIAYFAPMDAPLSQNTLIYLIAHPSREAADQDWAAFQKDPEWQAGGTHAGSKQ